jgi:hypothetical protein
MDRGELILDSERLYEYRPFYCMSVYYQNVLGVVYVHDQQEASSVAALIFI